MIENSYIIGSRQNILTMFLGLTLGTINFLKISVECVGLNSYINKIADKLEEKNRLEVKFIRFIVINEK